MQGSSALYAGVGLWSADTSNKQKAAVVALDKQTGAVLWTRVLGAAQAQHGGARSCVMDGADIVCAGYVRYGQTGFVFVADEGRPAVWRLNSAGEILTETFLEVEGMGQVAKIRKDAAGFVLCSTAWSVLGGQDVNVVAVVKLSASLAVEWSQTYGLAGGNSQVFDMLVDREGHYLLGGHTTVGEGVVNWDYLALRVDSQTRQVLWRKAWGQPRGFDARYIHDEMYGVAMDNDVSSNQVYCICSLYVLRVTTCCWAAPGTSTATRRRGRGSGRAGPATCGAATWWWRTPAPATRSARASGATRAATTPGSGSATTPPRARSWSTQTQTPAAASASSNSLQFSKGQNKYSVFIFIYLTIHIYSTHVCMTGLGLLVWEGAPMTGQEVLVVSAQGIRSSSISLADM